MMSLKGTYSFIAHNIQQCETSYLSGVPWCQQNGIPVPAAIDINVQQNPHSLHPVSFLYLFLLTSYLSYQIILISHTGLPM